MDVDRNHETPIELSSVSLVQNELFVKNLVLLRGREIFGSTSGYTVRLGRTSVIELMR
jgi:hypothetical protein